MIGHIYRWISIVSNGLSSNRKITAPSIIRRELAHQHIDKLFVFSWEIWLQFSDRIPFVYSRIVPITNQWSRRDFCKVSKILIIRLVLFALSLSLSFFIFAVFHFRMNRSITWIWSSASSIIGFVAVDVRIWSKRGQNRHF